MHETNPDEPARPVGYIVFKSPTTKYWVLRDKRAGLDYPFNTQAAAEKAIEFRQGRPQNTNDFLGSPIAAETYGSPAPGPVEEGTL